MYREFSINIYILRPKEYCYMTYARESIEKILFLLYPTRAPQQAPRHIISIKKQKINFELFLMIDNKKI